MATGAMVRGVAEVVGRVAGGPRGPSAGAELSARNATPTGDKHLKPDMTNHSSRRTRFAIGVRHLVAPLLCLATSISAPAQGCGQSVETHPFPARTIIGTYVGWGSHPTTYLETAAVCPYLIPLEVAAVDTDTMLIRCDRQCTQFSVPGGWRVDWAVEDVPNVNDGHFVGADALRTTQVINHRAVMFLPPEDLPVNGYRWSTITATIRNGCSADDEPASKVTFTALTARVAENHWQFGIERTLVENINVRLPVCDASSSRCTMPPAPNPYTPGAAPSHPPGEESIPAEMFVDEIRPIMYEVRDLDNYSNECGPVVGTGGQQIAFPFCDDVRWTWSIANPPGYTGFGYFVDFGTKQQTVLFKATSAGNITIKVEARSRLLNDAATFYFDMLIIPRTLRSVDFDPQGQSLIYPDGEATSYEDVDQRTITSGTPPTPTTYQFPTLKGVEYFRGRLATERDHDYPMAYVRNAAPLPKEVTLYPDTRPMPGTFVLGKGINDPENKLLFLGANDPSTADIRYHTFIAAPASLLPDKVGRHMFDVQWEVLVFPADVAAGPLQAQHRFYTTLAAPQPTAAGSGPVAPSDPQPEAALYDQHYRYWESAYDISCKLGSGANTAAMLSANLCAGFSASVGGGPAQAQKRKHQDGWGVTDDQPLLYWDEWTGAFVNCNQNIEDLLAASPPNGVGSCIAWAQVFRLCLGLHGESARCQMFTVETPVRAFRGGGVVLAGSSQTQFLVKDWDFSPVPVAVSAVPSTGGPALVNFDPLRVDLGGAAQQFWLTRLDIKPGNPADPNANCHDRNGVGGQGVANPQPYFYNHWIVNYGGKLFDPSYGSFGPGNGGFLNESTYAPAALDGYEVRDLRGLAPGPGSVFIRLYTGPNGPTFHLVAQDY